LKVEVYHMKLLSLKNIITLFVVFGTLAGITQNNLEKFDRRKYHFGFLLGANSSSFDFTYNIDNLAQDSILGLANIPQAGFDLNLLASLDISPNFHIRFYPGLSFQDRGINYRIQNPDKELVLVKKTESVFLEFPLLFKIRTNRVGNFAAYGLIGGKFGIDMQSQKNVNNNLSGNAVIIKLKKYDYSIVSGAGFDFFLPYFKFGIEFKSAIGLPDMMIHEDNRFSGSINSLKTRTFVVSINFEG